MAVRLLTTSSLSRTTDILQPADAYTGLCWFKPHSDFAASTINVFGYVNAGITGFVGINSLTVPDKYNLTLHNTVVGSNTVARVFTAGTWYPIVYQRSGAAFHRFWVGNILVATNFLNMAAVTFDRVIVGNIVGTEDTGDIAYFREWSASLTEDEIRAEFSSATVVKTASLVTDTPLTSDLLDISGNGNDWTASGANSFVANPTFPANSTSASAIVVTLPLVDTYDAKIAGQEFVFDLWFKYANLSTYHAIGIFGFGSAAANEYEPELDAFSPDAVTPDAEGIYAFNVPTQPVLETVADYYFRFQFDPGLNAPFVSTATLTLTMQEGPTLAVPDESILVNDDNDGYPLAILSSTVDYQVLRFLSPFISGEQGDVLPNPPVYLFSKEGAGQGLGLKLYDADLAEIADVSDPGTGFPSVRACIGQNLFYVGAATSHVFCTVDRLGTASAPVNVGAFSLRNLAANNDGTILYFSEGTANKPIKRWDLVGGALMADFLPAVPGKSNLDILVLSTDEIVIGYSTYIEVRDAAGVLLLTFPYTSDTPARLAYSWDDSGTFWAWFRSQVDEEGTFQKIRVSDGVVVQEVVQAQFEYGVYEGAEAADAPEFGASFCCPFVIMPEGFEPAPTPSPYYGLATELPIRWLLKTPMLRKGDEGY